MANIPNIFFAPNYTLVSSSANWDGKHLLRTEKHEILCQNPSDLPKRMVQVLYNVSDNSSIEYLVRVYGGFVYDYNFNFLRVSFKQVYFNELEKGDKYFPLHTVYPEDEVLREFKAEKQVVPNFEEILLTGYIFCRNSKRQSKTIRNKQRHKIRRCCLFK